MALHHYSLLLALGLLASLATVLAEDYTCPAVTDETEEDFVVGAGDSFSFNTNDGGKYARNMQCQVNYIMDASCKKKEASGARCTIKCVKAAPGATTAAPTTANP